MNRNVYALILSFFLIFNLFAQDQAELEKDAAGLLDFYQGTLNFLGDPISPAPEKLIIINESFSKMFLNPQVQIEDDLVPDRQMVLYKDVQAYLKDVDFFFRNVKFDFEISGTEMLLGDAGQKIIKLTVNRKLNGRDIDGDSISDECRVFVEMNQDVRDGGLKIASIYSTQPSERERPLRWWASLDQNWRDFFAGDLPVCEDLPLKSVVSYSDSSIWFWYDTAMLEKVRKYETTGLDTIWYFELDSVTHRLIDSVLCPHNKVDSIVKTFIEKRQIDRAGDSSIFDLNPLSDLRELEIIDISNTAVDDIFPLRNLNKLQEIHANNTSVASVDALRYTLSLREISLDDVPLTGISALVQIQSLEELVLNSPYIAHYDSIFLLSKLRSLSLSGAPLFQLQPVFADGSSLEELDLSNTPLKVLPDFEPARHLKILNISNTYIRKLDPLQNQGSLEVLWCDSTGISSLQPLEQLPKLRRIYCDGAKITKSEAKRFMKTKPNCLVIYESTQLEEWWQQLDNEWKGIFIEAADLDEETVISKESLHKLIQLKELNLSGKPKIKNLTPLRQLELLEKLDISRTGISDLSPISDLMQLENLNISNTPVEKIGALAALYHLEKLNIDSTNVDDVLPLAALNQLVLLRADACPVPERNVAELQNILPELKIYRKTAEITAWWNELNPAWKEGLAAYFDAEENDKAKAFYELLHQDEIHIRDLDLISSAPVLMFSDLRVLELSNCGIAQINALSELKKLEELNLSSNPLSDIQSIASLSGLKKLNISGTAVEVLDALAFLQKLQQLDCSNTQIKKLDPLGGLTQLEDLNCSGTKVKKLDPLYPLKLKKLTVFNTRVNQRRIDDFKKKMPECEVVFY